MGKWIREEPSIRSRTDGGFLLVLSDLDQALEQLNTGMDGVTRIS